MTQNNMALMIEISYKNRTVNPNTSKGQCIRVEAAKVPYYFNVFHNKQHMHKADSM